VDYLQLLEGVEIAAGLDRERAAKATRATLETLAERISEDEADALRAELPKELRNIMLASPEPEQFGVDEFVRRTAVREGVSPAQARRHATEVLATLRLDAEALESVRVRLPSEYEPLFGPVV
jgi:uncharacterized protein (DUF2267 family)